MSKQIGFKFGTALALSVLTASVFMAPANADNNLRQTTLNLQIVYDPATLGITASDLVPKDPVTGLPKTFAGAHISVLARLYPKGTFSNCATTGCGFNPDGSPAALDKVVGVMVCAGSVLSGALDPILVAAVSGGGVPAMKAAAQGVVTKFAGTPFVDTTHTYDFGATIVVDPTTGASLIQRGAKKVIGQDELTTIGYLSVYPDAPPKGDSGKTSRPIVGGSGMYSGANGQATYTVLGFFNNGRGFLTENVTLTFTSGQ